MNILYLFYNSCDMFNLVIYPKNCPEKHIITPYITYELIKSELAKKYIYIQKYNSIGI